MEKEFHKNKRALRCQRCDKPLAQIAYNKGEKIIRLTVNNRGKRDHVIVRCKHSKGGIVSIECENCQGQVTPYQTITLVAGKERAALNSGLTAKVIITKDKKLTKKSEEI